jgi:anti-sigma regulatory factor (Ser/Thr protein kinase)
MKLETTNHYLEWQNSYFKGFIKRHGLDNKLHEKDDEAIKEDVKND